MFQFIFLILLFIAESYGSRKIVNGTLAIKREFPSIVSIQLCTPKGCYHTCGGSIIDATHILTAAHCLTANKQRGDLYIQYGIIDLAEDKNQIKVTQKVTHSGYNNNNLFNDIAILTLEKPIQFDLNTAPVKLPDEGVKTPKDSRAVVAGWGTEYTGGITTRLLEYVDLVVYDGKICEKLEISKEIDVDSKIQICAGVDNSNKNSCRGDSGGPLYVDGIQVGIVSWGPMQCGTKGVPAVYTKVSMYRKWIDQQIKK